MKVFLYSLLLILSLIICHLTEEMANRPYDKHNMRSAFYHGCNLGSIKPLTGQSIDFCSRFADTFMNGLENAL